MNPLGFPWMPLMDMQPQRSVRVAWFVYGWIEREHVLNVIACADWWMRAIGWSAPRARAARRAAGSTGAHVAPQLWAHDGHRTQVTRHRSLGQGGPRP